MQHFRKLKVWKRSHSLTLMIYRLSENYPADERYGVTSQLRRAAASVPANIAEGSKRRRAPDYARFLNLAESSLAEVEYFLILSVDLGYLATDEAKPLFGEVDELSRMLNSLRTRVERAGNSKENNS